MALLRLRYEVSMSILASRSRRTSSVNSLEECEERVEPGESAMAK